MPRPPCALGLLVHLREEVEDLRDEIAGNPHPRVLHRDHRVGVFLRHRQHDAAARLHELRGVVQDVPDDDLHQAG